MEGGREGTAEERVSEEEETTVAEEVEGTLEDAEDAERVSDGVALRPERDFFSTKHLLHHQEGCSIRGQPLSLLTGGDIPVSSLQDPRVPTH